MTRERWKMLGVLLCAVLLLVAVTVWPTRADTLLVRVKTGHYQLDTGQTVQWWIDEPRALLCTLIADRGIGLTCLPLTATVYAWPAYEYQSEVKP